MEALVPHRAWASGHLAFPLPRSEGFLGTRFRQQVRILRDNSTKSYSRSSASVIWVHDKDHISEADAASPQFPCPDCHKPITVFSPYRPHPEFAILFAL